jgi:hypothetical protein
MAISYSALSPYLPALVAVVIVVWTLFDLRRLERKFRANEDITVNGWIHRPSDPNNEYGQGFTKLRKRIVSALGFAVGYTVLIYVLNGLPK